MKKDGIMKVVTGDGINETQNLYTVLDKLPAPMSKFSLSSAQKFWYNYVGKLLVSTNKLTAPDLIHLHAFARSIDYYLQAEEKIAEKGYGGLVQTFASGASNVSGHITLREKMLKEIDNYSKHFGFSFKDRQKLNEPTQQTNQLSLWEQEKLNQMNKVV